MATPENNVREFTTAAAQTNQPAAPHEFKIDGESFFLAPEQPAAALMDLAGFADATDMQKAMIAMRYLDGVLLDESAERFAKRMRDKVRPMSIEEVGEVVKYIAEDVYGGGRPLATSSPSPGG